MKPRLFKILDSNTDQKIPLIFKIYIYFNYIIGITFGGLVIRNDRFCRNRCLKAIGNVTTVLSSVVFVTLCQVVIGDIFYKDIYHKGFYFIYLFMSGVKGIKESFVVLNLIHLHIKSELIFNFLNEYPIRRLSNWMKMMALFLVYYFFIVSMSIFYIKHYTNFVSFSYSLQFTLLVVYRLHVQFIIQALTFGKFQMPCLLLN